MAGAGEKETVEERFNRLQHEVNVCALLSMATFPPYLCPQCSFVDLDVNRTRSTKIYWWSGTQGLLGELEAANGSLGKSSGNDVRDTVEMTSQMKFLSSQLSQVKVDALTGAWTGGAPAAHQADLTKRLLSDIANVKASAPADEAATAAPASDTGSGSGVTYELYYRPEESKFAHSLKTGELDRRIAALEGVVGSSPLSRVAAELDKAEVSMSDAVNILAARLSSLAPETIASLDTSLTSVIEKADAVKEKESGVPPETARKVDDLLALGTKWDAISDAVPAVIDRLAQLKELHERGANFGQTLTQLEATQLELKTGLADEKSMLATLEASFKANASAIEANFSAMDKRIEALNKNIAKLG